MISSLRRGGAAAIFALSLGAATAACGAGQDAETGQIRPDNANAQVDDIRVQNVNVILTDGTEGPGAVSARLFNNGREDQTLESVTLPGSGARLELTPAEGETEVVVPAGGELALGGEGNASAFLEDPAAAEVALGNAQQLVFTLSDTGQIELFARVVEATGAFEYYADWAPPRAEEPAEEDSGEAGGTGAAGETAGAGETGETAGDTAGTGDDEAAAGEGATTGDTGTGGETQGPGGTAEDAGAAEGTATAEGLGTED